MKNRNNLNIFIDVLLFVDLAVLAGIGWLMKFKLLPGRERILKSGENRDLLFLGLDRHAWGDVHLFAALVMLGLLVLHIVFHWKTILCLIRNTVPSRALRRVLTWGVICAGAVFFLGAFIVEPTEGDTDNALYRRSQNRLFGAGLDPDHSKKLSAATSSEETKDAPFTSAGEEKRVNDLEEIPARKTGEEDHQAGRQNAVINGQMTLDETAAALGISLGEARRRLGLPDDYPGAETLGRLRRIRGLTMIQIRDRLEKNR